MNAKWRDRFALATSVGLLAAGFLSAQASKKVPEKLDYNRDVRPIITKCFTCHGPSAEESAAGLHLDNFKGATKKLDSGMFAIVPGHPEKSELITRINATDDSLMPPADSHKTLSKDEKKVLYDWIAQGAEYKEHWAFVKPVRPTPPTVKDAKWVTNDIDRFILAKLEKNNLTPEPQADKRTLIRRVTLDLTGLPATPKEVDAFLADKSKGAYEKVVDRLLKSPRYGERMAMDWMDYSRYADSNGYQADFQRFQSRWRDWVINAYNSNMPYDEFTVDQIAGDLLPNATTQQKLATAFNRNHRINTEGGVIAEEWRIENVIDRVETTSAVWLGLTAGCARCHDHKYDPLTQKDFYSLCAYFNNVPESGTGVEQPVNHPPLLKAATPTEEATLSTLRKQIQGLDKQMDARLTANAPEAAKWTPEAPVPTVEQGLAGRFVFTPETQANYKLEGQTKFDLGRASGSIAIDDKGFADLGNVGDFDKDQPFSYGAWVRTETGEGAPFSRMDDGNDYRGWDCFLAGGKVMAHIINKWPENALKIVSKPMMPKNEWVHLFFTYDGSRKPSGFKLYMDGKPVETTVEQDSLKDTIRTTVSTKIGRRTTGEFFKGQVDDFNIYNRVLDASEVAKLASASPVARFVSIPADKRTAEQKRAIEEYWSLHHDTTYAKLSEQASMASTKEKTLDDSIPDVMVMAEMPKPRDCYVLIRGEYDKHGPKVEPALPSFLPPMPKGYPNNRLGLAEWIVSPDNPLMSRVTVNRFWERFFGRGLVDTIEDFGTRADWPTHPELLDYLATEFIRLKWDQKAFIKEMVMSSTYRQSSNISVAKLAADPQNKLLSRGPRFRLPGEVIRDQALFASGLLVEKIGGPPVRPYMPEGIWDETNVYGNLRNYKHDMGDGLYRRSLYTIWKRTAAPPNMLLFDVPSRETCRVHRARTDTPLQALTLMNDETYVEAARVLAERMIKEGGATPEGRIKVGFERVLSRMPTDAELKLMAANVKKRVAHFKGDSAAATKLIETGASPVDKTIDPSELAAYTLTASTLLNLDETLNKD
ncbi:MAG: DUF1553 domain-containing protein [Armatimonadetes bacterium]|nr:DUF1553 domain-containing protein [Armatimonadota bacterium]